MIRRVTVIISTMVIVNRMPMPRPTNHVIELRKKTDLNHEALFFDEIPEALIL
jgi:hypothetical protein